MFGQRDFRLPGMRFYVCSQVFPFPRTLRIGQCHQGLNSSYGLPSNVRHLFVTGNFNWADAY